MAGLRFADLQSRPLEFLDFTSLTLEEFQQLVSPFETAFHARMAAWRMDGKPRTARRFTVYKNCPLLTPEDRLLFILVYLKTYALQVVHGRLFGMVQGKANQWIHVLLPALLAALRALGDAPARSLTALAQRLGVSEADAATVVVPLEEEPAPVAPIPAAAPASPLLPMTGRNDASSAPRTLLNRKRVIAARKKTTLSNGIKLTPMHSVSIRYEAHIISTTQRVDDHHNPLKSHHSFLNRHSQHCQKCPARQCPAHHPLSERHPRRPGP